MLADKAYDGDRIRASLSDKGAFANSLPKSNRRSKPYFSTWLYRERNLIERFFSKLKHFRRVASRDDKLAENFLAMVQLASMRLWLGAYESTAKPTAPCILPVHGVLWYVERAIGKTLQIGSTR